MNIRPMIGRLLAQSALGITPELSLESYRAMRFAESAALTGAFGAGAVS